MATHNVTETQTEEVMGGGLHPRDAALHYLNGWLGAIRFDLKQGWTPEAVAEMQEAQGAAQRYAAMLEGISNG
jgi:hypothetical protein